MIRNLTIAILLCFTVITVSAKVIKANLPANQEKQVIDVAMTVAKRLAPDLDYDKLTPVVLKLDRSAYSPEQRKRLNQYNNEDNIVRVYFMADPTAFYEVKTVSKDETKAEKITISQNPDFTLSVSVCTETLKPMNIISRNNNGIGFRQKSYDEFIKENPEFKINKDGSFYTGK